MRSKNAMAERDNYTFANQSSIPSPLDKIIPNIFRSWDDKTSKNQYFITRFLPDATLIYGPKSNKGREAIKAFRAAMFDPVNGPVVDMEHTLEGFYTLSGNAEKGRHNTLITGSIWYRLRNGQRIDADFASVINFVDQGDGDFQGEFYEVYFDSHDLMMAINKMNEDEK